mmetsp:Transcript_21208/g.33226  ORF Transcript_21208/g.33226 Transcript_21208/m.33226 type:complete len:238 (-) Transcript_21208:24-737(-)|eukprot:CAMPEP_0184312450 /NCGR_PEP_ID=MMETSP1049-20130417/50479_1 /TAXON_ID=77928 /ORGANISM="Proteomonas sulcata, Strain CCMP704" /LENGTH=237 /DNA_ID=CAMNT_0026628653 /DNA_START=119 /DNA_END=832 /DNA_ORIENTATION=+
MLETATDFKSREDQAATISRLREELNASQDLVAKFHLTESQQNEQLQEVFRLLVAKDLRVQEVEAEVLSLSEKLSQESSRNQTLSLNCQDLKGRLEALAGMRTAIAQHFQAENSLEGLLSQSQHELESLQMEVEGVREAEELWVKKWSQTSNLVEDIQSLLTQALTQVSGAAPQPRKSIPKPEIQSSASNPFAGEREPETLNTPGVEAEGWTSFGDVVDTYLKKVHQGDSETSNPFD